MEYKEAELKESEVKESKVKESGVKKMRKRRQYMEQNVTKEQEQDDIRYGIELIKLGNCVHRIAGSFQKNEKGDHNGGSNNYILGYIYKQNRCGVEVYQKDIEHEFSLTGATVSTVLKHMQEKGLVTRVPAEHDARWKSLYLTERGVAKIESTCEQIDQLEKNIIAGMNDADVENLTRLLNQMKTNLSTNY